MSAQRGRAITVDWDPGLARIIGAEGAETRGASDWSALGIRLAGGTR
ncbi:hypothetical protein [Cryobacterium aureum]|nr:hypothetical protein [Cryobacterium aureum]